jgi:hypothetical protein
MHYYVYFTIYTYLHQLFTMFSGRLQHLPEFKFKFPASTTHQLPPLKYKPRFQLVFFGQPRYVFSKMVLILCNYFGVY